MQSLHIASLKVSHFVTRPSSEHLIVRHFLILNVWIQIVKFEYSYKNNLNANQLKMIILWNKEHELIYFDRKTKINEGKITFFYPKFHLRNGGPLSWKNFIYPIAGGWRRKYQNLELAEIYRLVCFAAVEDHLGNILNFLVRGSVQDKL
jgi:hypothetical protein